MDKRVVIILFIVSAIPLVLHFLHTTGMFTKKIDYSNCQIGDFLGEVKQIKYKKFVIYYPLSHTPKQIEEFALQCEKEGVKKQTEMDCCMRAKIYPHSFNK